MNDKPLPEMSDQELRGRLHQLTDLVWDSDASKLSERELGDLLGALLLPVVGALILDIRRIANGIEQIARAGD